MDLQYDIYKLNNSQGMGEERKYVRLMQHEPMGDRQLMETIQQRCSLTKGDVAAVLAELHDICVSELSMGRRFHIPEIGYLSLSVGLEMPENDPNKKITGREVRLKGISFRPEAKVMTAIQRNVHFVRADYSRQSVGYTEEKILAKIKEYLQEHRYITARSVRILFGLTSYMANKWLNHFCENGTMVKEGTRHSPIYFLA